MKRASVFVLMTMLSLQLFAQSSEDSVTITFRAHQPAGNTLFVPGQFNNWGPNSNGSISLGAPSQMEYNVALDAYVKTYTFKIHDNTDPRRTMGDSVFMYKFNKGGSSSGWYSDPLNPEQNPTDNNNSVLRLTRLFFFQPYMHLTGSDIDRIVIGIVQANSDTLKQIRFYFTASGSSEIVMDDVTPYFNLTLRILDYTPSEPIPKNSYLKLVAVTTKGDSVVYQKTPAVVQLHPLPSYAKHGVTLAGPHSGDSTTFRLQVPGKTTVALRIAPAGNPLGLAPPMTMYKSPLGNDWWLNVKLLPNTQYEYVYELDGGKQITDPFGRYVGTYGTLFSTGAEGLSADNFLWTDSGYQRPPLNKLIIYEMHIGEFAGGYYGKQAGTAGFSDLKTLIPYFDSLGVNAIELMPITDYGNVGRSGHSWGYDVNSYFALEPAYGTARQLKELINEAHRHGIAVILDVVFNHQNDTGPLWQMLPDEAANPYFKANNDLRYNEDPLFFFKDMDHWTAETQELILTNLRMWIDEFRIDGFRYDFTQGIGWNYDLPKVGILGWANAIDTLYKGQIYQIAEHLPESPALLYYSGLTSGWHDAFRDEIFNEARFKDRSLLNIENFVLDLHAYQSNDTPAYPYNYANRTEPVNATITHDEQSLIYEMTQFQGVSVAEAVQRDKLYGAFPFLSLGIPMLWMGQEFSAPRGWPSGDLKLSYRPLEWDWLLVQRGIDHFKWYKTLVTQRLKNPALYQGQLKRLYRYDAAKVLVWGFEDTATNSKVMCVANLSPLNQTPTNLPWLGAGKWYDIFDQTVFDVSGNSVASFPLQPFTIKVYSNKTNSELGITSVKQQSQTTPTEFRLEQNYPNPFNPTTTIAYQVPASGHVLLTVYDIVGRKVATLVDEVQSAGRYATFFDASSLASGVYFYKLTTGNYTQVKRMSVVK